MRVIGIDPSLTGTCCYDGTDFHYIQPKKLTGAKRMAFIRDSVMGFVGEDEVMVVMEDFAFSRAQFAHDKGGLGWILRLALLERGKPGGPSWTSGVQLWAMKPNSRAMLACGKGNAAKPQVVSETSVRAGMMFATDDHCDAYLLWVAGRELLGYGHEMNPLPKTHLRALEKLEHLTL